MKEIEFVSKFISQIAGTEPHIVDKVNMWTGKRKYDAAVCGSFNNESIDMSLEVPDHRYAAYLLALRQHKPSEFKMKDFYNVFAVMGHLKEGGKGACIISRSSAVNLNDSGIRRMLLSEGMVEAVIALPEKVFDNDSASMLVIISRNNKNIRFIDCRDCCSYGRRRNEINDNDIDEIIRRYKDDDDSGSVCVKVSDILDTDNASFDPVSYLANNVGNTIPFGDVIFSIKRGALIKADELDQLASKEKTDIRFLPLGGIKDSEINIEGLPYLSHVAGKYVDCIVRNGDILISKNGAPFRVASVDGVEDNIVACSNLYIIKVENSKIDRDYLMAFLLSDKGLKAIEAAAVGTTIPSMSLSALKNMKIPYADMEEQHRIGKLYQEYHDEVKQLRQKLQTAQEKMKNLL